MPAGGELRIDKTFVANAGGVGRFAKRRFARQHAAHHEHDLDGRRRVRDPVGDDVPDLAVGHRGRIQARQTRHELVCLLLVFPEQCPRPERGAGQAQQIRQAAEELANRRAPRQFVLGPDGLRVAERPQHSGGRCADDPDDPPHLRQVHIHAAAKRSEHRAELGIRCQQPAHEHPLPRFNMFS